MQSQVPESLPLIHLVEEDADQAEVLKQAMQDGGYRVQRFNRVAEYRSAWVLPDRERPAAVILGMAVLEGEPPDYRLIAELGLGRDFRIPVVVTSIRNDLPERLAALRAGACRYLAKPFEVGCLLDMLGVLMGRHPLQPYRVLLVDDDPVLLEVQAGVLRSAGLEVRESLQPLQVLDIVMEFAPDVVVLDVYMPEANGPELAAVLREHDALAHLSILFLSTETDTTQQLQALNLGGDDFLVKPVRPDHLVAAVTARARRARQNRSIQQRLQTSLYEREREHLALNHHAYVSITDGKGNITYANDGFCAISGYSREELIGENHRILKSGLHPAEFYSGMWRVISSGEVWQGEICNRRKDGSLYWVRATITPFMDSSGKPYQYVAIRTDITQVKEIEAALRESESRLNFLVSSSPVTIYTCEAKPPYAATYISQNVVQLTGFEAGCYTENAGFWAENIHPEDRQAIFEALPHLFEGDAHQHEYRFRASDGSYRWMHDDMRLVRDEAGEPFEIIGYWADISRRKQVEQALETHKERLRRGQIHANVGTWDWNIQTGDLFWTERIGPLFGYAEGELETSYANFLAAVHPDDRQAVVDAVTACVERGAPYEIEHRVVWPDGSIRWLLERGAVVHDGQGRPLQMLGVVQDIDDRKRAELALAERERQLREAQKLAHIGNWHVDLASGHLDGSEEVFRIFGFEPADLQAGEASFDAAAHPEDREKLRESRRQVERTGLQDVVYRILRPDGTVRHVHQLGRAEADAAGKGRRLSGTLQDITERMEAQSRLRETEERFAFAVEGAGDGVWDWDMRTNAMRFSRLYMEMLGYAENELPQHADTWVAGVHPDDLARIQRNLADYLEGRVPVYDVELRLRCKNGNYKWILCRGRVVSRDEDGQPVRMIGIHSDITERKGSEQALVIAREAADRANQAKSEFLSSMSHELRTPMNAILGFGQLMEYSDTLPAEHKDSVGEILKAGRHLLELINEVLDLAKVESGRVELSLEPVEVEPIVEECLSLVGTLADKRNIRLILGEMNRKAVRADRTRFKQVLLNLLSNAIKYNREGGRVHLETQEGEGERLRILVRDTGMGIHADRLAELFQPFNRLGAEATEIEGTGIGLTITRRLVEVMGGAMGVVSEVGAGSTFWIELPSEPLAEPEYDQGMPRGEETTAMPGEDRAQRIVLYIEDNPTNLKLVAQILGRRRHLHLLTAHTPELGIELALSRHPDVILLDINMPGMDGYQVLEVLRAEKSLKAIPVIAVTANAMPRDIERGLAAGFADYLTKPLDVARFNSVMDQWLASGPGEGP